MSVLGLLGLVAAALVVLVVIVVVQSVIRRRSAARQRPRTVADLVRLRAEVSDRQVSGAVPATADAAAALPAPVAIAPVAAAEPPTVAASTDVEPASAVALTEAVPAVAAEADPADTAPQDAEPATPSPAPRRDLSGSGDTPWGRAARMAEGERELWAPPSTASADEDWSEWTDWAEIDSTEDPGSPSRQAAAAPVEPAVVEPADVESVGSEAGVSDHPPETAASEVASAGPVAPVRQLPVRPVLSLVAPTEPPSNTRPPAAPTGQAAGNPAESASENATWLLPVTPELAVVPPAQPPTSERSTTPMARPRLTDEEAAAEQAAADLALLRTFGFNGTTTDPAAAPVVALSAVAPAAVSDGSADGEAKLPVAFRVVGRDRAGIAGAAVTLLDDHGVETADATAGADGSGRLLAPHPGSYVLVSTAPEHQPGAVAVSVLDATTDTEILLARSATLSGSVYGEDGPIVGARLILVQDGERVDSVDSAADGAYRISDLAAGEYGLSVSAPDCEPVAVQLDVAEETDVVHNVDLEPAGIPAGRTGDDSDDLMIGHR